MRYMIRKLTIIALFFFIFNTLRAGENEKYIEKVLSNIENVIQHNKFVRGTLYFQNDSIETDLLLFKKRDKINAYLFCVAKIENDSTKVFTANEIIGYRISNELFIRHNSTNEHFFIKKIKTGKIDLYEKKALPSDNQSLFYLKIPNYKNLLVINPSENNISEMILTPTSQKSPNFPYFSSKMIPQKFKEFISIYFGDCAKIKNLVDSEFYTINDIPSIVDEYNNCF